MKSNLSPPRPKRSPKDKNNVSLREEQRGKQKKQFLRLLENNLIRRVSYDQYREKVRDVYDGPKGAILSTCSALSLHTPLGERLLRERKFDLAGARHILDVGSGAGQIARHVLRYADANAQLTCMDLSWAMLRRARNRLRSDRPKFAVGDLTKLPFGDGTFDCVTCGYVLEHLPDAADGLSEIARVLVPGGRVLLLTSEDTFGGAWTSRLWYCRTYNRQEIRQISESLGLKWSQELWFSRLHKMMRAGGICVELVKE